MSTDPPAGTDARAQADDDTAIREARIVAARMRLRQRFVERQATTPPAAAARGEGAPNRHGMPKLPPGQYETRKWPVLDLGRQPAVTPQSWRLRLDGACAHPVELSWDELLALPQTDDVSDFHCVTTWSRMDLAWRGVRFLDVAAVADPHPDACFVLCHGSDGYSTNLALADALQPDVLLAHTVDGRPLPAPHGGPVRLVTPRLYAWKGAKWLCRIEFLVDNRPGYWEQRGYSDTARPWVEDRYG